MMDYPSMYLAWKGRCNRHKWSFSEAEAVARWHALPAPHPARSVPGPPTTGGSSSSTAGAPSTATSLGPRIPGPPATEPASSEILPPPRTALPSTPFGVGRYPDQTRPHPRQILPAEDCDEVVWKRPFPADPSISAPWPGVAENMCIGWSTSEPHATLEDHGQGFVGFLPDAVRIYATALRLPEPIIRRLELVNINLAEAMLALRWRFGLENKVFANLLNISDSWSTLPESMPEWDEVRSRNVLVCCNRELDHTYDLRKLYKVENQGLCKDTLLLAVVNEHQYGNDNNGVVHAPLEISDKVRTMDTRPEHAQDEDLLLNPALRARGNIVFWLMRRLSCLLQDTTLSPGLVYRVSGVLNCGILSQWGWTPAAMRDPGAGPARRSPA